MKQMQLSRIAALAAAGGLMLALSGCPQPVTHHVLNISPAGEFSFDGVAVPKAELPAFIAAQQERDPTLFTEIVVSPQADMADVRHAVDVLKRAHARMAFVEDRVAKGIAPTIQPDKNAPAE